MRACVVNSYRDMSRPLKTDASRLSNRLIVRLTDEDKARICANAQKAGLGISEYVRRVAIDGNVVVKQQSAYGMALASQLRHIGINLNQLTRDFHIHGEYPPELGGVCAKLEIIFDRIIKTS